MSVPLWSMKYTRVLRFW
ncbi:UNVERIFIED_CONTAM: hypothetical protein GTU68_045824 [Idotea baltica]|nr:hypothetical protein [Idotea baltica]